MDYVCLLTNAHVEVVQGKGIIKNLEELYIIITDLETRTIEIRSDFFEKFFTETGFHKFKEDALKVNKYITFVYDEKYVNTYNEMAKDIEKLKDFDELMHFILNRKDKALPVVRHLAEYYNKSFQEILSADSKLSTVHLELIEAVNSKQSSEAKYEKLLTTYQSVVERLDTLVSRINYQYEKDIDVNKMNVIELSGTSYRKILYIKEITRVHYVDTFIKSLQEILKTVKELPARLVVIEAPHAYHKSKLYPGCKPHTELTYNDVFGSDIFMAGFQQKIIETVLNNPSKIDFLIVLDRGSNPVPHLTGSGVETLYTVSDIKDIDFTVDNTRLISYRTDTLRVPYIEDFDELSPQEVISDYSSMDIVKAVIKLLER